MGVLAGLFLVEIAVSTMQLPIDKNMAFGIPHFLMMGMNPVDLGIWSQNDVEFSTTFATCAERNAADLRETLKRIKEMQVIGLIKQFIRKTLTNYYNGSFSWGAEGNFFLELVNTKSTPGCNFFRSLYYTNEYAYIGKYYIIWSNFEQMIWLTIVSLNIFSGRKFPNNSICVIMLSILGLTLFELLFEARARYLFTYAPLYIILAIYGFKNIILKLVAFGQLSK